MIFEGVDEEDDGDGGLLLPKLSKLADRRQSDVSLQCLSCRQLNRMIMMSQTISYAPVPRLH
jgi:hypothetical protein